MAQITKKQRRGEASRYRKDQILMIHASSPFAGGKP
jgi:hypothetical protein